MGSLLLTAAVALQCGMYSVQCQCGPSIPFEGFQIYVVENCDAEERWHIEYGGNQFSTDEECTLGISENSVCKEISGQNQSF